MSAGNSADKPQFVENQMLTHDSLNNLVEFSAGRTQRVMKALGLGGTVSGVSWSFDEKKEVINITPGFIIFPDGEIVEIAKTVTLNDIGTDGVLKYETSPSNPTKTAPSHLCVSYEWATEGHRGECFSTASDPHKVKITWKQHIQLTGKGRGYSPNVFQPLLLPTSGPFYTKIRDSLNTQITIYNQMASDLNDEKFLKYDLVQIPLITNNQPWGIGIYGDISFELAYFAKRLMTAAYGLLRNRAQNTAGLSANTVNIGVANTAWQYVPAEIDSLLFEVFLAHNVVSDSIKPFISEINKSTGLMPVWPENRPQGIYSRWRNVSVSGIFLNTTAQVLSKYCDTVYTTSIDDFHYLSPTAWWQQINIPRYFTKVDGAPHHLISSFLHVSDQPSYLEDKPNEYFSFCLGFIKPYREWLHVNL